MPRRRDSRLHRPRDNAHGHRAFLRLDGARPVTESLGLEADRGERPQHVGQGPRRRPGAADTHTRPPLRDQLFHRRRPGLEADSRPGPDRAMCARPGIATGSLSPAARRRRPDSTRISRPPDATLALASEPPTTADDRCQTPPRQDPASDGPGDSTVAHDPENDETPVVTGVSEYRYRDSKRTGEGPVSSTLPANRKIRFFREPPSRGS
jgi:hypothetical protein